MYSVRLALCDKILNCCPYEQFADSFVAIVMIFMECRERLESVTIVGYDCPFAFEGYGNGCGFTWSDRSLAGQRGFGVG